MNYIDETIAKFDAFYYLVEHLAGSNNGLTEDEISEKLGKSKKTVRRYLESIECSIFGLDLLKERGPDRRYRYRVEKHATPFRPLVLNANEILSLYFIRGFAHFKDVSFVQQNLLGVFDKIKLSAKEAKERSGYDFYEKVSNLFVLPKELGGKIYNDEGEVDSLNNLVLGALSHKVCEISYGSSNEIKKYLIGPLHFFNYRDAIYLLAKNIELSEAYSKDIFTNLALHRVNKVIVLDDSFEYPKKFNVKKHFKSNSFNFEDEVHSIKLKFPARTKEYILEREWYPNQSSKVQKDGSLILEFESDLNLMVKGWIRGFGPDVEVLEPLELRKKIIEDLKKNLKQY